MKLRLTIYVPCKREICAYTTACLTKLTTCEEVLKYVDLKIKYNIGQSDLPKVRSEVLNEWFDMASENDIFMFLDADQTFTYFDILKGLSMLKDADVVCGGYMKGSGGTTIEPVSLVEFYDKNEGEILYGATGFMMIKYSIVKTLTEKLKKVRISVNNAIYPFFYERIVKEEMFFNENTWFGEDYSFCYTVREHGGKIMGFISQSVGHIMSETKYYTNQVKEVWPENSVVYYCGTTVQPWTPDNPTGGSELAVVKLAEYWESKGYKTTVFCNTPKEVVRNGVYYLSDKKFCPIDQFNILIFWRRIDVASRNRYNAKKIILDLHDLVEPGDMTERLVKNVDKICVKSQFHASLLGDIVPKEKVEIITNGGKGDSVLSEERDLNCLVYASSYDRGLGYMLKWGWPKIKSACPNAVLKVFYGWGGYDAMNKKTKNIESYKEVVTKLLQQDGVIDMGKVHRDVLLKEKAKANIHYYVGDYQEIDCISVRESADVGCIPVVSGDVHVFNEKKYCLSVAGDPRKKETQEQGADNIITLLQNPELCEQIRSNVLIVPESERWCNVAERWIELFKN